MAANEPSSGPKSALQPTSSSAFPYIPLSQDVDSIRLVKICPTTDDADQPDCELVHAAFRDKPKFETLSYMWGDESVRKSILLNGIQFAVGENLWDALRYLRHRADGGLFWIDALSINQSDTPERNRQLRMMPHIYFRATSVVVWLGQKYAKYQANMKFTDCPVLPDDEPSSRKSAVKIQERRMVEELVRDGYWNRLWIVQEIGLAKRQQVCFGNLDVAWGNFISLITRHSRNDEGPLKLARQLEQKYTDAHTFRKLLFSHRDALCKDPKDKIYALLGLAVDARGFPVDYNKSLMEVWVDTMEFMNERKLFQTNQTESDIIECGKLIRFLLMGSKTTSVEQIEAARQSQPSPNIIDGDSNTTTAKVFHLRGYAIGRLVSVGPSTLEITSSTDKADEWAFQVAQNFKSSIGNASQESRRLLEAVLNLEESDFAPLSFNHVSPVRWRYSTKPSPEVIHSHYMEWNRKSQAVNPPIEVASESGRDNSLYQLHHALHGEIPWKMGITSGQARAGDILCWVRGSQKAVVVRVEYQPFGWYLLKICGTALTTDDIAGLDVDQNKPISIIDHNRRLSRFDPLAETLLLMMDAKTVFLLLPLD